MNIRDRIKAIDDEYSESEIYLEYGLPSLMLYEPTPYKNLIVDINIERDKYTATEDRMKFISLYKQGACGHFFRPLCLYSFYNLED